MANQNGGTVFLHQSRKGFQISCATPNWRIFLFKNTGVWSPEGIGGIELIIIILKRKCTCLLCYTVCIANFTVYEIVFYTADTLYDKLTADTF